MSKIIAHPDKDEIIKMLTNGVSVQKVEQWLKDKHPNDKKLHITWVTLQAFRKKHLNLNKEVITKLRNNANATKKSLSTAEKNNITVSTVVQASSPYQEKMNEVQVAFMDVPKKILELDKLIGSRIEYYFNKASSGLKLDDTIKADKAIVDYIKQMTDLYRDWKKLVEGLGIGSDGGGEGSIRVDVVYEQVGIIRDVVGEMLNEIDPSMAISFLDKLTERLNRIEYTPPTTTNIIYQTNKINNKIIEVNDGMSKD